MRDLGALVVGRSDTMNTFLVKNMSRHFKGHFHSPHYPREACAAAAHVLYPPHEVIIMVAITEGSH